MIRNTNKYIANNLLVHRLQNCNGFTLIEMIIVMGVFMVVLYITSQALQTVTTKGGTVRVSEQSNIGGMVGLEIMRRDIMQAGVGLFTFDGALPTYAEGAGAQYSTYNDANSVPRAVVTGNNLAIAGVLAGTDYLVIKSTTVGLAATSQLWTYILSDGTRKQWGVDDFTDTTNKMIVLERDSTTDTNMLKMVDSGNYCVGYTAAGDFRDALNNDVSTYLPASGKIAYAYGIMNSGAVCNLRAPFNRADFYVERDGNTPASCSPAAGVLYKASLNHADGTFTEIPILDCVAEMQVVLGWNTTTSPDSSLVDTWSNADGSVTIGGGAVGSYLGDPESIRKRLKMVMVYLLAQDGRLDRNFSNSNAAMLIGDQLLDPGGTLTRTVDLTTANFINYRWKLYRIVVRPKNLS